MKRMLFVGLFATLSCLVYAGHEPVDQSTPRVGDVLAVGKPKGLQYQHIDFPRLNFIVKQGGLPTYETVYGQRVVITAIEERSGAVYVTLERTNGKKFFRHLKSVTAHYRGALESGELSDHR